MAWVGDCCHLWSLDLNQFFLNRYICLSEMLVNTGTYVYTYQKKVICRCLLSSVAYIIEIKRSLVSLILVMFSTVRAKTGFLMWEWVLHSVRKLTQLPERKDHSPSIAAWQPEAACSPWLIYYCSPSSCNSDSWEASGVLSLIWTSFKSSHIRICKRLMA